MGFTVEYGVVQMGDAPPLGDIVPEQLRQPGRRVGGYRVAPGAELCQLAPFGVQGEVAVHHGADADGADGFQPDAIALENLFGQLGVAAAQPGPHIVQRIGPDAVFISAFPGVAAGGDGGVRMVD